MAATTPNLRPGRPRLTTRQRNLVLCFSSTSQSAVRRVVFIPFFADCTLKSRVKPPNQKKVQLKAPSFSENQRVLRAEKGGPFPPSSQHGLRAWGGRAWGWGRGASRGGGGSGKGVRGQQWNAHENAAWGLARMVAGNQGVSHLHQRLTEACRDYPSQLDIVLGAAGELG